MKGRALVIGEPASSGLRIVASMADGRLDQLAIDRPGETRARPGAIFAAKVTRVLPQGGAFVDLGEGETGFLVDAMGAAAGVTLIAQVLSPATDEKAARLTSAPQLRDRLLVFTPTRTGINASKKLGAADNLKAALAPFEADGGFILRTAAAEASPEELTTVAERLVTAWRAIARAKAPALTRPAPSAMEIAAADWLAPDVIVTAHGEDLPEPLKDLATHRPVEAGEDPLDALGVRDALDELLAPRCALTHGWMALERTEALIAVDVNAGDAPNRLAANLAAAREIPRQLRLRGWGGMVLIDFAGRDEVDRARLEAALRQAADASLKVAGWGPLGLLEATRRRDAEPIETVLRRDAL